MVIRRAVGVVVGLAIALPLAACDYTANAKGSELCGRYDELAKSVETLRAQNPLKARASDLHSTVHDVQRQLDQLQAVAEGRLDSTLTTLRADVTSELESAVDDGGDALATSRPAIEDALTNVNDTWARAQVLVAVQCGTH